MNKLVIIGTSSGVPTANRSTSSCALIYNSGSISMFDCGEGTQGNIASKVKSIKLGKINRIFITHLHGDHVFGIPGLLASIGLSGNIDPNDEIKICGPKGIAQFIENSISLTESYLPYRVSIYEICKQNEKPSPQESGPTYFCNNWSTQDVFSENLLNFKANQDCYKYYPDDDKWDLTYLMGNGDGGTVIAAPLNHTTFCIGYVLVDPKKQGSLDSESLKLAGFPSGPLMAQLKKGIIVEYNGTTFDPKDYIKPAPSPLKVVILGDNSSLSESMKTLAMDSDLVTHECTYDKLLLDKAIKNGHSTSEMAGKCAKEIRAKRLVLKHFSPRYSDDDLLTLTEEALVMVDQNITKIVIASKDGYELIL